MPNSSSPGPSGEYRTPNLANPSSNQPGAPASALEIRNDSGFDKAPQGFNPVPVRHASSEGRSLNPSLSFLKPASGTEESVEDEIKRKIAELEEVKGRGLTGAEAEKIAGKIRSFREDGWLTELKYRLAGQDTVPIEDFNRLAAEYEGTIAKMVQIRATVSRRVTAKDAEIENLKNELKKSQQVRSKPQDELRVLKNERQQGESRSQGASDVGEALTELNGRSETLKKDKEPAERNDRTLSLQEELELADRGLDSACQFPPREYNELQSPRQQANDADQKGKGSRDEIGRLGDAEAAQGEGDAFEVLQRLLAQLEAQFEARNQSAETLEGQLAEKHDPSPLRQDDAALPETIAELQARCTDLRAERDMYKDRWAQNFVKGGASLTEFWQAVKHTLKEIKQLYEGIRALAQALGLGDGDGDGVVMTQVLDKIVAEVTAAVTDAKPTLQLALVNVRGKYLLARIRIETLERQLNTAGHPGSDDGIRAQPRVVDEVEVEKLVSSRTQTYREQHRAMMAHVLSARGEFLALADNSVDRVAIEALADEFLQPSSMPVFEDAGRGAPMTNRSPSWFPRFW